MKGLKADYNLPGSFGTFIILRRVDSSPLTQKKRKKGTTNSLWILLHLQSVVSLSFMVCSGHLITLRLLSLLRITSISSPHTHTQKKKKKRLMAGSMNQAPVREAGGWGAQWQVTLKLTPLKIVTGCCLFLKPRCLCAASYH